MYAQTQSAHSSAATAACHNDAQQIITRARASLVMEHPFFGSLALRLRLKADPACADMWTDGKTLVYNPAFAAALSPKSLVGALAHEVLHLAFGHHLRRKGRDSAQWNRACDLAVNHILLETGFTLPQGFTHNPAYAGMSADEIFEALASLQDAPDNKGSPRAHRPLRAQKKPKARGQAALKAARRQNPPHNPRIHRATNKTTNRKISPTHRQQRATRLHRAALARQSSLGAR